MQCAHRNLCPEPSRQPRLDPEKNTEIKEHEIRYRSTKALISYTDIEGAFVDVYKSSILVYNDIEVLNFDVDVSSSSISYCVDLEVLGFKFDIEDSSISYWFDIECYNLRFRRFSELRHSISNVKTFKFDIAAESSCNHPDIVLPDHDMIEGHFPTFDIEGRQGSRLGV